MADRWVVIAEREGVGRLDTWIEYLCVRRIDDAGVCELAICCHEPIAEIPSEWFDDEGEPLPEFKDSDGCLALPEYYEMGGSRTKLTGHDGEYLLGELVLDEQFGGPVSASLDGAPPMSDALESLGWKTTNPEGLRQEIKRSLSLAADR